VLDVSQKQRNTADQIVSCTVCGCGAGW